MFIGKQISGVCGPCQHISTSKVLELLHMDLMGPMKVESIAGKKYIFVCVDDFSRFTWVYFIKEKSDTFDSFKNLCLKLKNEKNCNIGRIVRIKNDRGKEFENSIFSNFFNEFGISHEFSSLKSPQQNGVVERKFCTLQEMARVMLNSKKLSNCLWVESMNTTCRTFVLAPRRRPMSYGKIKNPM